MIEKWRSDPIITDLQSSTGQSLPLDQAEAALRGCKLKDLIEEGLRLVFAAPRKTCRNRRLTELIKRAQSMIDSGVPDLASNPDHFKDFGRDAGHR